MAGRTRAPRTSTVKPPMLKAVLALALAVAAPGCSSRSLNLTLRIEYETLERTPHYSRTIDLFQGAELKLVLHSNGTTGALWTDPAQLSDPTVLEQTDHRYIIRPNPNPGEPGHEEFTFETKAKGECTVFLEYKRPFSPEVTYTCTINVKVM